jgi:ankyrin repeat protein
MQATASGRIHVVQLLLDRGVNMNIKNKMDMTALDIASRLKFDEIAWILESHENELSRSRSRMIDMPLTMASYTIS